MAGCPLNTVTGFRSLLGEILKETHLKSAAIIHVYTRHTQTFAPSLLHFHVKLLDQIYEGRMSESVKENKTRLCFILAASVFSDTQL